MAARTAEIKARVTPELKEQASEVFARWGISLSDAVNAFLRKSVDAGGFPFDVRDERIDRSAHTVIERDPQLGYAVLPAEMDDDRDDDGLYDDLV